VAQTHLGQFDSYLGDCFHARGSQSCHRMTVLAKCIDFCEDATRFVKTLIAFLIANVAVGLAFQAKRDVNNMMRMVTHHTGIVAFLSNFFTMGFAMMYIVNAGCVLYSFLGLSCIRNCIFRERRDETAKCRLIQMCLGPCCATYQQIMVWITLAIQIGLSYAYLLLGTVMGALVSLCHGGNAVVSSFQGFLDEYHSRSSFQAGAFSPMTYLMNMDVTKYCEATKGMDEAFSQCFTGCLLSVISQVLMIMVISEEKGRIEGTMADGALVGVSATKEGRKGRKGKRRNNVSSSSSSSSDSDVGTDPLRQYRAQGNVGGRNYKLPGGYR